MIFLVKHFLLVSIIGYQWVFSPFLHWMAGPGFGCKYRITCSRFAYRCISMKKKSLLQALRIICVRLWNCSA